MSDLLNLINKILKAQTLERKGFSFEFKEAFKMSEYFNVYKVIYDVKTSTRKSYFLEELNEEVEKLLELCMQILDIQFSYSLEILVNGEKPKEIYLSKEILTKIVSYVNQNYTKLETVDGISPIFEAIIKVEPRHSYGIKFYSTDGSAIVFNFFVDIIEIIESEIKNINDLPQFIYDDILDTDEFRSEMEGEIYNILNKEFNLDDFDTYVSCIYSIRTIDGEYV